MIDIQVGFGRIKVDLGLSMIAKCRLVDDQKAGLVEIGRFELGEEYLFEYSYVSKVMSVLGCMSDGQRTELGTLLGLSLRQPRVCGVLGLWLDVESGLLYLVTERKNDGVLSLGDLRYWFDQENQGWMPFLSMVGVELCEAFVGLQSEGIVCGCLGLSCLCFDEFGHVYIDLGEVLLTGRKIYQCVLEDLDGKRRIEGSEVIALVMDLLNKDVFISPEMLFEWMHREGIEMQSKGVNSKVDYSSDLWLFACVLLGLITGKQFAEGMRNYWMAVLGAEREGVSDCKILYLQWVERMNATLEALVGSEYPSLQEVLMKCLDLDPANRPLIPDAWETMRGSNAYHCCSHVSRLNRVSIKDNAIQCLVLGELCNISNDLSKESTISGLNREEDNHEAAATQVTEMKVGTVVEGLSAGKLHCNDLQGHLDCVTSLCIGGGFLFSASFDKTINVWSLQDFTHMHTFRGHEQKVMAVVFVDQEKPLCISADNGGGIFCWEVVPPLGQEPLKKWHEEKDWRYSGIHALAISESGCLYTGSGDRLIKAWSLRDYTLICSMEGHKSVVSTLASCNGVLYSGSWDGTVRLWCLHDHSPLVVFGEGMPGRVSSVLSLHADQNTVIAAYENGCVKIWANDELKSSTQVHQGAVFALSKEDKWVFTGGWDRSVKIQEISGEGMQMDIREVGSVACESVITALLYEQGMLFAGYANKLIKVYHCGS